MPEVKFKQYEVFIASGDNICFDGRFRFREEAIGFIKNYLNSNLYLPITDICCTEIGTETDLLNVKNI